MFIKKILFFVLLMSTLISAQTLDIGCGTEGNSDPLDVTQRGGRFLTASGELKVLVVFAKFLNDTEDHIYWPTNGYPTEMQNFIDPNQQTNSLHFLNLTNYFDQMSYSNFKVIGTAVGVTTPHPKSYYIQSGNTLPDRAMANKDALLEADNQIDFSQFDNWTYSNDYNHENTPDGIIDMVIVVWRGIVFEDTWSGEASLGWGNEFYVANNQKIIRMKSFADPIHGSQGSGVTVQYWDERSRERNFHVCIHEMAHWLISGKHPYEQVIYKFWGMLTLGDQGVCANSFEREKLAWLNPTPIDGAILSAPLSDFISTPVAYKYHPNNGLFGETYYFENHQRQSVYDDISSNINDKGIFILHLSNSYYVMDCMRVISSDGFWKWQSPYSTNCWDNDLRSFYKAGVNRAGYGHREKILSENYNSEFLYSFIEDNNQAECNDWLHGYGFNSGFTLNYNNVFSPWSNPRAYTWQGQPTDFLMRVNNDEAVINVSFGTQYAINGPPSKPFLGAFHAGDGPIYYGWAYLAWGADYWDEQPIESDINWSELQRKISDYGTWQTVYSGPNRHWSDHSMTYDPNGTVPVYFRVRVRDTQNKWSIWSDLYDTRTFKNLPTQQKISIENNEIIPIEYELTQNFPNPFNPNTIINYSIKDAGFVKIKVFDILGGEVAELVNETKEAGYHSVVFNANNLPSGVFIYTLQINGYSSSRKMLFLK